MTFSRIPKITIFRFALFASALSTMGFFLNCGKFQTPFDKSSPADTSLSNGSGQAGLAPDPDSSLRSISIPDPIFPSFPPSSANQVPFASDGDTYIATDRLTYGSAITSIIRNGFEYVVNDPPATPQYKRGGSMQGSFFFNSPLDPTGTYRTFYNDCNNPLESGSVADFNTTNKGIASPTNILSPRSDSLQFNTNLAFYVDPNGPTDWFHPTDHSIFGTSPTCRIGMINNPTFLTFNNAALSGLRLGKSVVIGNIGTTQNPIRLAGVIAVDMVLNTDMAYSYSGLHPAFAAVANPALG